MREYQDIVRSNEREWRECRTGLPCQGFHHTGRETGREAGRGAGGAAGREARPEEREEERPEERPVWPRYLLFITIAITIIIFKQWIYNLPDVNYTPSIFYFINVRCCSSAILSWIQ